MDITDDRIAVPSNKFKLVLLTISATIFVGAGIWLFDGEYVPRYEKGKSILTICFFGVCGVYGLIKLFDGTPGLVLDREGIVDNASDLAVGRVPWREIRDIRMMSVSGQRFLGFVVNDPEKYLNKGNVLRRLAARRNYKTYGTPIFISSHFLKLNFDDLQRHVQDFRGKYGSAKSSAHAPLEVAARTPVHTAG